jgi:hypothetical protein
MGEAKWSEDISAAQFVVKTTKSLLNDKEQYIFLYVTYAYSKKYSM